MASVNLKDIETLKYRYQSGSNPRYGFGGRIIGYTPIYSTVNKTELKVKKGSSSYQVWERYTYTYTYRCGYRGRSTCGGTSVGFKFPSSNFTFSN
jgi:hypothetical protein